MNSMAVCVWYAHDPGRHGHVLWHPFRLRRVSVLITNAGISNLLTQMQYVRLSIRELEGLECPQ